ncbi:MAG: M23 family metallopeptidase [Wenzhouxiangella sp.]|nr:MAG: M23 family metallopeptidase [Wenzhouxiangella sp.]
MFDIRKTRRLPKSEGNRLRKWLLAPAGALMLVMAVSACQRSHEPDSQLDIDRWPADLVSPIPGATFSLAASHLPGAPRDYRNGIHQGFDFFNGVSGKPLADDEAIVAIADGEIIRIDHEVEDEDADALGFWATLSPDEGFVGEFALDRLRGRQVWIRHAQGHVSRYAHLSMVHPELQLGDTVEQGQAIGLMGNSGVPPTETQPNPAPHLHFELWSPDGTTYLGQGLSPLDSHRLIAALFGLDSLPRFAQRTVNRINAGQAPPETYPPDELPEIGFNVEPPNRVAEGRAFAIPVLWEGDDFRPGYFFAFLEDQPLGIIDAGDGAWVLGAMPSGLEVEALTVTVGGTDPFGQTLAGSRPIQRDPARQQTVPQEVEPAIFDAHNTANFQTEGEQLTPIVLQSLELGEALWQLPFDAPVNGDVRRPFGQRIFHGILRPDFPLPGVEVAAPAGAPVQAVNTGIVGLVADLPIRGRTVAVMHGGGVVSLYSHLADTSVSVGEEVAINQPLGTVGSSGATTEAGLRWEMLISGIPTDPIQWPDQVLPGRP